MPIARTSFSNRSGPDSPRKFSFPQRKRELNQIASGGVLSGVDGNINLDSSL
jgi:hypothetical protein